MKKYQIDTGFLLFRKSNTRLLAYVRKVCLSLLCLSLHGFKQSFLQQLIRYIENKAPNEYHKELIPQYSICHSYLRDLARTNNLTMQVLGANVSS
jgi:hypothetical protein